MIFSVSDSLSKLEPIAADTFVALNIWERQHIEEWVRANPELLGEDLLVVSTEFDRFVNSSDRLDVLAIDRQGNIVVVELKRDSSAAYADLQALRYAAMVSSMTVEKLLPYYRAYLHRHGDTDISVEQARSQLLEFVEADDFKELSSKPRIILCSEGFSHEITTTVLWLRDFGVDIRCVKLTPYKVASRIVVVPKIVIPLEEARQYLIDIRAKQEEVTGATAKKSSRQRTMQILLGNGILKVGDPIFLSKNLPSWVQFEQSNPIFQAFITGKLGRSDSIRWAKDQKEYSISGLAWQVFKDLHPEQKDPGGLAGSWFWADAKGRTLWELAEDFLQRAAATTV